MTALPRIHGTADALELHEKSRYRTAAVHARRVYPGPVGELVGRELNAYAEFGYRFSADSLIPRLAAAVLATPAAHPLPSAGQAEPRRPLTRAALFTRSAPEEAGDGTQDEGDAAAS
jgi:hypothetical protein